MKIPRIDKASKNPIKRSRSIFLLFMGIFLIVSMGLGQTAFDSRNMEIPIEQTQIDSLSRVQSINKGENSLRLHYNIGVLEKVTGFVFTQSRIESELDSNTRYMGIEPHSFSKPSQSLFKIPIGFMATNFKKAIQDDPEASGVVTQYRLLKTSTALLLISSFVAGFITVSGVLSEEYTLGQTKDSHIIIGSGLTFGLVGVSIIPSLFNRGKIQKATRIYNHNKRK